MAGNVIDKAEWPTRQRRRTIGAGSSWAGRMEPASA